MLLVAEGFDRLRAENGDTGNQPAPARLAEPRDRKRIPKQPLSSYSEWVGLQQLGAAQLYF
jgi:hypothetical protein